MELGWVKETSPTWDDSKARIIGGAPAGIFDRRYKERAIGELMPGDWWRVTDGDNIVGFGWMDVVWGDAEILLAISEDARGQGVGSFVISHLIEEARGRGLNYLYNIVRPNHPAANAVTDWLIKRGFKPAEDGTLRRGTLH